MSSLKKYWRRFTEKGQESEENRFLNAEFLKGAAFLDEAVSRRNFLKIMGASAALMGAGCSAIRKPVRHVKPYGKMQEYSTLSESLYFSTTASIGEDVLGVLVESSEGRPTKIEGNPLYPGSQGKSTQFYQAEVLSLYDPDRVKEVTSKGSISSKANEVFLGLRKRYIKTQGEGLSFLMGAQVSPTVYRLIDQFKLIFPKADIYRYEPINSDNKKEGLKLVTGKSVVSQCDFSKADVIVSFDDDFLGDVLNKTRNTMGFSSRRSPEDNEMNRLYMFESNYSLTGAKADHRIKLKPSQVPLAVLQLVRSVMSKGGMRLGLGMSKLMQRLSEVEVIDQAIMDEIALDLIRAKGKGVVVAGAHNPPVVHEIVYLLNQFLKNNGRTVTYRKVPFSGSVVNQRSSQRSISLLASQVKKGQVKSLVVLGGNPVFNAPADINFAELYAQVEETICVSMHHNETTDASTTVIPMHHFLESWGDAISQSGTTSLVQPIVNPMVDGVSDIDVWQALSGNTGSSYDAVRRTWRRGYSSSQFSRRWKKWLHDGVISEEGAQVKVFGQSTVAMVSRVSSMVDSLLQVKGIELRFYEDHHVYDGRFSNNGWLQEMSDPITKLTWDNAVLMSPRTARKLNLKYQDVVKVAKGDVSVKLPVYILPGHADNALSVSMGYGGKFGRVGSGKGVNVYPLRTSVDFSQVGIVSLVKTRDQYQLASTQEHGSMEGRPLYREASIGEYKKHPNFAAEMVETPPLESLFPERPYDTGYQWGMVIDLSKCTGCNACVVGCQSENNIPIVGKKEVLNGREMHWIRVDRYFEGDENNPRVVEQPVTCLQCENAPCEQVCPVAATVHSEEGLNDMVYNRCVGTRYCSDNCPAKVRRFNFFDYHQRNPQSQPKERKHLFDYVKEPAKSVQLQFNPDVSVRMRGVMEKCTYCVQRITKSKIKAKNESRLVQDGEIKTACQQTCPADAIVFGNILDEDSKVSKLRKRQRNYHILEQLHLKPRTTYLASITNPNPEIVKLFSKEGA